MVFARAKLLIEDNCFEEDPGRLEMTFTGPNLSKMYAYMFELMKSVFNVSEGDVQETSYQWGKSKDGGDKFTINWWVHKDMDVFTYLYVQFRLSGQSNDKDGKAFVRIRGLLRSEYPQDTVWQRSLFYEMMRTVWHRMFYYRKREEYGEECRHTMMLYQRKLTEFYHKLQKKAGEHEKTPEHGKEGE